MATNIKPQHLMGSLMIAGAIAAGMQYVRRAVPSLLTADMRPSHPIMAVARSAVRRSIGLFPPFTLMGTVPEGDYSYTDTGTLRHDVWSNVTARNRNGNTPTRRILSGLAIVLFTDIEDSTGLTWRLGDAQAQEILHAHDAVVREGLRAFGGREIKHTGDGIMASFPSVCGALGCAVAIQQGVSSSETRDVMRVRIGLNAGEPVADRQDLFGTTVQLARRVCDQAAGGEVFVSDVVRQLAAGKGFLFADRGELALRGFEEPVRVYEVRLFSGD